MIKRLKSIMVKEPVFCISAVVAVLSMFFVPPDKEYLNYIDFRVLSLLFCLMAVIAGFKAVGLFDWLTYRLFQNIRNGRVLSVTLILLPFFCSMFITNDVALITFIPFTIALAEQLGVKQHIISITVFQTVAANLGSMATPVGNPQNLYLYEFYNMSISDFLSVTLPLTLISLIFLLLASVSLLPRRLQQHKIEKVTINSNRQLIICTALFVLCLLTVFRVIPYPLTTAVTVAVIFVADRKLFKDIDYMLLLTFVCFFIISENFGRVDVIRDFLGQLLRSDTLLTAVGTSQIISNVPAAVVLSGFTQQWKLLLSGVNIGGLGTPVASLASLITIKLYMHCPDSKIFRFLRCFTVVNVIALIILLVFARIIF